MPPKGGIPEHKQRHKEKYIDLALCRVKMCPSGHHRIKKMGNKLKKEKHKRTQKRKK
jgi:hypothetical protein